MLRTPAEDNLHYRLAPVVEALEGIEPGVGVAVAAEQALESL